MSKSGPKVTNLFFADDSLIFCRVRRSNCMELMRILKVYRQSSGQEVNMDKSGILLSKNTRNEDKEMVKEILGVQRSIKHDIYLGLPIMFGRSKAREFKCIKEKLVVRINGWNKRLLSQARCGV